MTPRWLFGVALCSLPPIVIALASPTVALAQNQPPPPAIGAPVSLPPPPVVVAAPPAPVERPMRFILTGGTVVIGVRVGEDAEFFTVSTSSGLVRVRKTDIASMDFNINAGTGTAMVAASPSPLPSQVFYTSARPSRPGRGLLIAGTVVFSISYGLTVFAATIASVDNSDAFLLLLPVAGPIVYGAASEDVEGEGFALLFNLSLLQGAGLLMLVIGAAKSSTSSAESQSAALHPLRLGSVHARIDPVLAPGLGALALSGTF